MIMCSIEFWNHIDGEVYELTGYGDSEEEAFENAASLNNCGKRLCIEYYYIEE